MNSDNNENEIEKKEENFENNNNIIDNNIEINQDNNKLEIKEGNQEIIINNNDDINRNENLKINKIEKTKIETHDISENVVTMILDKIISDILVEKRIKDIYKNLPSHCFDYMKKLIDPYLRHNFLLYENGLENLSFQKRLLYDRSPINKANEWGMIKEPTRPGLDRFANGKNKLIKFTLKDEVDYNDRKNDKNNETETDINNSEINNNLEKNKNNEVKNESNIIKEVKEEEINKPKKRKRYKLKKTFGEIVREKKLKEKLMQKENNDIKNNNKNNENEGENEHSIVLEMTSQDLKNIDMTCAFYNDNEENDLLRKEREILLIEKEKERIKLEKQKKKKKVKKIQITKDFEPDKLTFDSNGQIIKKRIANLEEIKKDFNKPKLKIIDFNSKTLETPVKERKSIKQKISINRIRNINRKKPVIAKEIKEEKEQIIFNPNDKNEIDVDRVYFRKSSNEAIDISGNNFELVNPEVGVVITNENENMKKEGGFDYLKKYNKPSINDYSKLSYNSQNSRNFSSYMDYNNNNSNNNSINEIDNANYNIKDYDEQPYLGYKEEFNDNNNPLLQGGYQIMTPINSNKKYNSNILNAYTEKTNLSQKIKNRSRKELIHSYDNIKLKNSRYNRSDNSIKLNENIENNNLQSIFLENDDYNNNKNYKSIDNESYIGRNLLNSRKRFKRRRELPIITESNGNKNILNELVDVNKINKFNFLIVKNKKWGNDIYPESPIYQKKSNLTKSQNYLQSEGNMNKFRKSNLNSRIKNSGINIVNNVRQWRKKE